MRSARDAQDAVVVALVPRDIGGLLRPRRNGTSCSVVGQPLDITGREWPLSYQSGYSRSCLSRESSESQGAQASEERRQLA